LFSLLPLLILLLIHIIDITPLLLCFYCHYWCHYIWYFRHIIHYWFISLSPLRLTLFIFITPFSLYYYAIIFTYFITDYWLLRFHYW
jgi:hypothetical protein